MCDTNCKKNKAKLTAEDLAGTWTVRAPCGARWWPRRHVAKQIEASRDPAATALAMCDEAETHGNWGC